VAPHAYGGRSRRDKGFHGAPGRGVAPQIGQNPGRRRIRPLK
jgi:hypothetical protein